MLRFYSKPIKNEPRISVVGEHKDGLLKIAVARCSIKDQFVKKTGRTLAEKRLSENKLYEEIRINNCRGKDFAIIADIIAKKVKLNCNMYTSPAIEIIHDDLSLLNENDLIQSMKND